MIPNYNPYFMQNSNYAPPMMQTQQNQSPFVSVRSEAEARNYPVGFGNSVNFKDENSSYVYVKTMGFSQLDKPTFEKYRLIKEETEGQEVKKECQCEGLKTQFSNLETQISSLWDEIDFLKERKKRSNDEHPRNSKSVQTKSNSDAFEEI